MTDAHAQSPTWRDFDVEGATPDREAAQDRLATLSETVRARRPEGLDLVYGPHPRERIDLFPCGREDAPLILFIHGGYWRLGDKARRAFAADMVNRAGISWGSLGYPLAPETPVPTIVDSVRRAVNWLARNGARHGVGGARLVLCGHSAGAHLAAMAATDPQVAAQLHGLMLISGLYDLRPLVGFPINDELHLDDAAAAAASPLLRPIPSVPRVVAWANEPAGFIAQGHAYHDARTAGATTIEIPHRDHFSILEELTVADSPLTRAMVDLAQRETASAAPTL